MNNAKARNNMAKKCDHVTVDDYAKFDRCENVEDDLYIRRSDNLKRFSIAKFRQSRMKHHTKTLFLQYVHSTANLKRQLESGRMRPFRS